MSTVGMLTVDKSTDYRWYGFPSTSITEDSPWCWYPEKNTYHRAESVPALVLPNAYSKWEESVFREIEADQAWPIFRCASISRIGSGDWLGSCKKCGLLPNPPRHCPPSPLVWSFSGFNFFFFRMNHRCAKQIYTWSHLRIFIFASVISV